MNPNLKILLGIVIIVSFLFLLYSMAPLLGFSTEPMKCEVNVAGNAVECPHEKKLQEIQGFLPMMISAAVIVGAGTYYLMSSRIETTQQSLKKTTDTLLLFLNADEKKLVNLLIENQGKILQVELTRLPGMSKVKSHRTVQKLLDRGVIEKETMGKTKMLRFTKEIKEGLF